MKDFYGKTYRNNRFSDLLNGLFGRLDSLVSDFFNLGRALSIRPLVLPATLMISCSALCYISASFIPSLVISVVIILFTLFFAKRSEVNKTALMLTDLILCISFVYIGIFISSRLNAGCDTADSYICEITEVSADISGDLDMTVKLENGALCKVRFYCEYDSFNPGDVLKLYGKLKEPDKAGNPGEFDYREYLRKQGILYTISCKDYETVRTAGFPFSLMGIIQRFFFKLRKDSFDSVSVFFDEPEKALTAAVCLGDKSLISSDVKRSFSLSCCSHLLAVSGTHFAGFLACLPMLLNILHIKRDKAFITHAALCILIGCLTGWSESVTRASIMSICVFADREWLSAVSLASSVMVLADPFCPMSSGFQMSFCAVIAIKVYGEKISDWLIKLHLGEKLASLISLPISAGLGLIPFWTDISMRTDPAHLVVQIAGTAVAGASCTFFIPCVLLCRLLPFLTEYLSSPLLLCLKIIRRLVSFGSRLSESGGKPVHLNPSILLVLGISVFLYMLPPCMLRRIMLKPFVLILALFTVLEAFTYFKAPVCCVIFADVGQGDCCLVITSDKTCLIDGGTWEEGSTAVSNLLDHYGLSYVDYGIMSHWDVDHAGGIAALYEQGRLNNIYTSYIPDPGIKDKDVEDFFKSTEIDESDYLSVLKPAYSGDLIILSDSVYIEVLYPSENIDGGNESSLVLKLHIEGAEETKILFTGDIGSETESRLVEDGTDLDCDILKVAHHGSKYSSTSEFIDACSPDIAVISVGANNFYGHPAPSTLERLENYGCSIFRTDIEGAVMLEY